MRKLLVTAALATFAGLAASSAGAHVRPVAVEPDALINTVACRVVRERVERPNGSVVFRTRRECGPREMGRGFGGCRVVRERVERPNGSVVFRTRRVCR